MQDASWQRAASIARQVEPLPPTRVGLNAAVGGILAQPVAAVTSLPVADCAEVAGWATCGIGPWEILSSLPDGHLLDGTATPLGQGQVLPQGTDSVLAADLAFREGDRVMLARPDGSGPAMRSGWLEPGLHIIPEGSWTRQGDPLIKPGVTVTPGTVALAAAAGVDDLTVIPPPSVAVILRQDGYLPIGPARRGKDRALVGEMLASWAMTAGARCLPELDGSDQAAELAAQIDAAGADVVLVSASAHPGSLERVGEALGRLGAETLIEGLAISPGGPVILAELRDGRRVLALPHTADSATVALATILDPMLEQLAGIPKAGHPVTAMLRSSLPLADHDRAVPVVLEVGELADLVDPVPWHGPYGLAPLGQADGLALIAAGRGLPSESVPVLKLPGAR